MGKLRKYFFSGLVAFLPVALTAYFLFIIITFSDGLLGKYLKPKFQEQFGFYPPGISIIVGVCIILVIGFFVTNFLGRRIYAFFENLLLKLPFFKQIYPALKEIALFLFSRDKLAFKQVAIVEYPRKGIYSIGFLTNDSAQLIKDELRSDLCNVFIPTAPGPLTGFVVMVPKKEIIFPDISVEETIKFIVSGGVLNPIR
jgi:uncharacterized membrane protein